MNLLPGYESDAYFEDLCSQIDARFSAQTLERYHNDPVLFVREIIGGEPTKQQVKILKTLQKKKHVAVRSGHGIGKSTAVAWTILWFLCTRPMAKVPTTAPSSHQLYDILWSELAKWHRQMNPTFANKFEFTADRFYHKQYKNEWFAVARTARKEAPEALQGFHGDNLLFILEEAAGVPSEIFEVAEGALTSKNNMVLMVGNPTRLSGFFFDAFNKDRAAWHSLHFSSLGSPLVDKAYPERMAKKYGESSNIFRVRVLGEFPTSEDDQLIPLHLLERAVKRDIPENEGVTLWAVDVARFGADETVICKRKSNSIEEIQSVRNYDTMETSGWVAAQYHAAKQEDRPVAILVDVIGIGAGVCDRLRELQLPVIDVNVASSPSSVKYANLRAELYCEFRDWLQAGECSIPDDSELIGQASAVKYKFESSGKILMEKKEELKKRGLPSPDRADAVVLTFAYKTSDCPIIAGESLTTAFFYEDF